MGWERPKGQRGRVDMMCINIHTALIAIVLQSFGTAIDIFSTSIYVKCHESHLKSF